MRITEGMTYLSFLNNLQQTKQEMADAELQVTSGKKVNKPSDDPSAAADIVQISGEQAANDQFTKNINAANAKLNAADTALSGVQTMINRVVQLGELGISTGSNAQDYVQELQGLRDQMISVANTTDQGRYIFGGTMTTTPPYVKQADSSVTYQGNNTAGTLQIGPNTTVETQIPGSQIFSGSVDIFSTMSQLISAMQAGDSNGVATQVAQLQQFSDTVSTAQSRVGGDLNVASAASNNLSAQGMAQATELNNVQSSDMAQAITQLTLSQTNLQATLAVGARIAQMSLLDYLK
jgi:flagellar hook-associated protein 3 FlgL